MRRSSPGCWACMHACTLVNCMQIGTYNMLHARVCFMQSLACNLCMQNICHACTYMKHASCRHTSCRHTSCRHTSCRHASCRHTSCRHASCRHLGYLQACTLCMQNSFFSFFACMSQKPGPEIAGCGPEIAGCGPEISGRGFWRCSFRQTHGMLTLCMQNQKWKCCMQKSKCCMQSRNVVWPFCSLLQGFSGYQAMPTDLNSRVFSTDTLVEGISLVKMETGMDPLRASNAEIAEELAKLQDCLCIWNIMHACMHVRHYG